MKAIFLVGLLFFCSHLKGVDTRQVMVHFVPAPNNQDRNNFSDLITSSLEEVNNALIQDGYIAPTLETPTPASSWWQTVMYTLKAWYYSYYFPLHASRYPEKPNKAFFTHQDNDLRMHTIYIPDGVSYDTFVTYLWRIYGQHGVTLHVDEDSPVTVQPNIGLEGVYLTLEQVEALKKGIPIASTIGSLKPLDKKEKAIATQDIQRTFLWHQKFPTVGLWYEEPAYPFIPHWFSLWDLAPHKGKGVTVAVLDTGVSAFSIEGDTEFKKNINLTVPAQPLS